MSICSKCVADCRHEIEPGEIVVQCGAYKAATGKEGTPMKYKKKPVVIEAVRWTGENHAQMCEFLDPECFEIRTEEGLIIHTLEGDHHASVNDYIIRGIRGEFYPCKPDIFEATYEPCG